MRFPCACKVPVDFGNFNWSFDCIKNFLMFTLTLFGGNAFWSDVQLFGFFIDALRIALLYCSACSTIALVFSLGIPYCHIALSRSVRLIFKNYRTVECS